MDFFKEFEKIKSSDSLPEEKFIVDGRKINVPQALANIGVRNDNHAETVEFEMQRYFDGIDLSEHLLHIDFINAGSEADSYLVETVTSTSEKINFIWNISNKVTKYKGTVKFALRFSTVSEEEKVIYAWHSEIAQFNVLDGLSVTSSISEQYPDLLQQWENRMKELDDKINNVSKEVNSKLLNTNSDFNIFVEEKKKLFNDNFEEKKDLYNQNSVSKLEKYNSNSEEKLKIFNDNADEQKELYNQNHLQKIDEIKALNVYTKEEVDYMMNDKMDKPYVPLTINDNTTIENTLSGNFKIDSIEGNCYQDSLENVSPSPERNIPIISKKIDITVPSENVFDLQTESNTDLIPEEGTYKSIAVHQLKPSTEYKIGFESVNIPAKTNLTLRVKNNSGTIICNIYTFFNMESTAKIEQGVESTFTTDSTGNVSFEYNCMVNLSNTIETYREYWYTKITNGIYLYENKPNIKAVELRSLKESVNLWDAKFMRFTENNDIVGKIWGSTLGNVKDVLPWLKPNTVYTLDCVIEKINNATNTTVVNLLSKALNLYRINHATLPNVNVIMINSTEVLQEGDSIMARKKFTTPADLTDVKVICYTERYLDNAGNDYFSKVAFRNIMLIEGTSVPSSYVPCTVRDYKIVDPVNKKSYIERNVKNIKLTSSNGFYKSGFGGIETILSDTFLGNTDKHSNCFCTLFKHDSMNNGLPDANCWRLSQRYLQFNNPDFNEKELWSAWVDTVNLEFQYRLATSITEEIEYLESDTSEFGVSSQDSTSPSPNIKSEIEKVEILNIKACAKNMFNPQGLSGGEIVKFNGVECYKYIDKTNNFIFDFSYNNIARQFVFTTRIFREDGATNMTNMHFKYSDGTKTTMQIQNVNQLYTFTSDPRKILKGIEGNYSYAKVCYIDLSVTQLEESDIATEYEPYKETVINHTLANPLMKCGDIVDTIDLNKLERKNNIYKEDITTLTINSVDNVGSYNHKNTTNRFYNLNKFSIAKSSTLYRNVYSTILPYVSSVWTKDEIGITINARNQVHVCLPNLILGISENDSSEDRKIKLDNYIKSLKGTGNEYIYYALETPTTEPLEPELVEKIKQLKTYGSVTHVIITGKVKPTINGRYPKDVLLAQQKLEIKLINLQTEVIKNV